MKRLIIIRHAKAEVLKYDSTDFERNLKKRGVRDSKFIAGKLKEKNVIPDFIISSKASRSLQTARIFAETLSYPKEKINQQDFLYDGFTTNEFVGVMKNMDNGFHTVMVFGHNPSIESLAYNLLDKFAGYVPTCAAIGIDFQVSQWNDIEARMGKLSLYEFPKKYE